MFSKRQDNRNANDLQILRSKTADNFILPKPTLSYTKVVWYIQAQLYGAVWIILLEVLPLLNRFMPDA